MRLFDRAIGLCYNVACWRQGAVRGPIIIGACVGKGRDAIDDWEGDDESNKDRVQELYTRLCTEDNADLLISSYSSGLTAATSVIAEQYGKVMLTTGAASDANYKQGYTQVFQIYTPASRYLAGAVDLLRKLDPSLKKIAIVHENAKFATSVVEATKEYAESLGYE